MQWELRSMKINPFPAAWWQFLRLAATFQTATWSILALGLRSLSRSCFSSCLWDGSGSRFSTGGWTHGNTVSHICLQQMKKFYYTIISRWYWYFYHVYLHHIAKTVKAKCHEGFVFIWGITLLTVQSELNIKWCSSTISLSWNIYHTLCFYFMQIVLQETRPKSPGRGQSKGSHRGRLQKTRAHKVRTVYVFKSQAIQGEWVHFHHRAICWLLLYMLNFSFAEGAISFFFVLFAVLLFTRDPKFVTGWSVLFKKG